MAEDRPALAINPRGWQAGSTWANVVVKKWGAQMARIIVLSAALVALLGAGPASAEDLRDGVYESKIQGGGVLRVIVDGRDVGVSVKTVGCLGNVEGTLARNKAGDLFMVSSNYAVDQCAISIAPSGKFGFSMRQGPECSYNHGAACDFNGFVERVR